MTPLTEVLMDRIRALGPLTIAEYMAECLLHPQYGYYTTQPPFGAEGDFVTAPEISQMFGELIGLCLAQSWLDQGAPERFALVELGPGRGTLMVDILRATQGVPRFPQAADIHLIEASDRLRAVQAETLKPTQPHWHSGLDTLPPLPMFAVANEFFDALPARQFVRDGSQWRERQVGLEGDTLCFGLSAPAPQPALDHRLNDTDDGDLVEVNSAAHAISAQLGAHIDAHGGAALLIDYGDWRSLGDTLQALKSHEYVPPLDWSGQADLTQHVDFEAIAKASQSAHTRLTPQGLFLGRLGIAQRAEKLAAALNGKTLESHIAAFHRLTHPDEMGTLFKVLGLYPQNGAPPPGLDRSEM
jgi:SAM-dependent MidA family methyltransferase